ncbi:MAG: carbohydrate-binding domain-containing protein [Clostridia bacterium]|nr:carbohydrate-binding domain-containing protein [Clostridia bacterium]
MHTKRISALLLTVLMLLPMTSCSSEEQLASKAVDIFLEGPTATSEGDGVHIEGGQITISSHGIYRISGTLAEGQILVDCADAGEVWLLLDEANITCSTGACIYVKQADLTHISLEKDTVNTLTDGVGYIFDPGDDEPDGTLFARDDLVLQGEGSLVIDANFKNAIAAKDDLTIAGGTYDIVSVGHGIKGKDSVEIKGGMLHVEAVGDGVKSTEDGEAGKGFVEISGGKLNIIAADDALSAVTEIRITGGEIGIETENNALKCDGSIAVTGGTLDIVTEDDDFKCDIVEGSADAKVTVNGETFTF